MMNDVVCCAYRTATVTSALQNCVMWWRIWVRNWPTRRWMRWSERRTLMETVRLTTKVSFSLVQLSDHLVLIGTAQWSSLLQTRWLINHIIIITISFYLFGSKLNALSFLVVHVVLQCCQQQHVQSVLSVLTKPVVSSCLAEFVQMMTAK